MNVKSHPLVQETRVEAGKPSPFERLIRLGVGVGVTFVPVILWALWTLALGADYIAQNAWRFHLEPIQIYVWLLIAAGLLQLVAVFLLRKLDQKPRDWVAIVSLIDTAFSIALALFFWTQISSLIFRAT
jgi:hypothetical protein